MVLIIFSDKTKEYFFFLLILTFGLLSFYWPMFSTGFENIQTDEGDTRINMYMLEHGYRWLVGFPHHDSLWSPPVYYPLKWTAPCTDTLIGVGFLYWPWRSFGFQADTAYQAWLVGVSVFNFLSAFCWLRFCRSLTLVASLTGSFVIAFSLSRSAQLGHPQLLPFFYILTFLFLIEKAFLQQEKIKKNFFLLGAGLCLAGQFYASLYLVLFWVLIMFFLVLFFLLNRKNDGAPLHFFVEALIPLIVIALLLLLLIYPGIQAAMAAKGLKPYPPKFEMEMMIPRLASWFSPSTGSFFYGSVAGAPLFKSLPAPHEHHLFMGLVTTITAIFGLIQKRGKRSTQAMTWMLLSIILFFTNFSLLLEEPASLNNKIFASALFCISVVLFFLKFQKTSILKGLTLFIMLWSVHYVFTGYGSLWEALYNLWDPVKAIRAVSRVGLFLAIPLGFGLASLLSQMDQKGKLLRLSAFLIAFICMTEQLSTTLSFSKQNHRQQIAHIVKAIPKNAEVFFYSPQNSKRGLWLDQLDGMFAQLEKGIPTINGNLNVIPLLWEMLAFPNIDSKQDEQRIQTGLRLWKNIHQKLNTKKVIWVKPTKNEP